MPDDGIHIEPHYIRRVTSYDGAVLEEARPAITDVLPPDVARTMVAMLEDVVQFGTGVRAKELGRPSAGKTGTTNDFTDAWYIGFTPQITTGVWVGNDDKRISLGKTETGARAALPIWLEYMQQAVQGTPVQDFPNVVPLEKQAAGRVLQVDTPDTAPPADAAEQGLTNTSTPPEAPAPKLPEKIAAPLPAPAPAKPAEKPSAGCCDRQGRFRFSALTRFLRRLSSERVPSARFERLGAPIRINKCDSAVRIRFRRSG